MRSPWHTTHTFYSGHSRSGQEMTIPLSARYPLCKLWPSSWTHNLLAPMTRRIAFHPPPLGRPILYVPDLGIKITYHRPILQSWAFGPLGGTYGRTHYMSGEPIQGCHHHGHWLSFIPVLHFHLTTYAVQISTDQSGSDSLQLFALDSIGMTHLHRASHPNDSIPLSSNSTTPPSLNQPIAQLPNTPLPLQPPLDPTADNLTGPVCPSNPGGIFSTPTSLVTRNLTLFRRRCN